ncbi:HIT domain-containing protein [Candidatus Poribacteria bacterium]|nr:HIT domain-containing protein [Candidatus Poribacteria bacterium]
MRNNLFVPNKLAYIKGKARPNVECILCAIIGGNDQVERLEVYQSVLFTVSLNLYPYSPGHLLIFPKRHILDSRQLTQAEILELHTVQGLCLDVLDAVYQPHGYNIGYNIGGASGASIEHLHLHVVPRYPRELGFIDIIGGAKIIVEEPKVTQQKLRQAFAGRSSEA